MKASLLRGSLLRGSLLLGSLLLLTVGDAVPVGPAAAADAPDITQLIATAKTPADHEKIAAYYDKEAAADRASAELHRRMLESYRKAGGALIEKWHLDHHCESLINDYEKAATMNATMAETHRKLAAEAK
jgi:hypothetical protein